MGWLAGFIKKISTRAVGAKTIDLIFATSIPAVGIPGVGEPIEPDECYIELYLESLRLEQARRFATRFHGVAYSFVSLPREGEPAAQIIAVSKPEKLAELDGNSVERVIVVSKQMMGPVPYRGGPLSIELGLFSVKSSNLLSSVLDYVTKISSAAGISYVGAIKPFIPLITGGMDLIAGQVEETALEVGIDTDLNLTTGCVAAIIARPKGEIDEGKLSLDKDRRLLLDGKPLTCGYAVYSIRRTLMKADYGEIPELKERYGAFIAAIRSGKKKDARDALTAFRLATIASADLTTSDAELLVEKAKNKMLLAFPPEGFASFGPAAFKQRARPSESLENIGLYSHSNRRKGSTGQSKRK